MARGLLCFIAGRLFRGDEDGDQDDVFGSHRDGDFDFLGFGDASVDFFFLIVDDRVACIKNIKVCQMNYAP